MLTHPRYIFEQVLSLDDLKDRLNISKPSVSLNMRALETLGMVRPVWVPGDRRSYYAASMAALDVLLERRAEALTQMVLLAERGMEAFSDVELVSERLTYLRDFYAWFDREYDILIERWRDEQRTSNV